MTSSQRRMIIAVVFTGVLFPVASSAERDHSFLITDKAGNVHHVQSLRFHWRDWDDGDRQGAGSSINLTPKTGVFEIDVPARRLVSLTWKGEWLSVIYVVPQIESFPEHEEFTVTSKKMEAEGRSRDGVVMARFVDDGEDFRMKLKDITSIVAKAEPDVTPRAGLYIEPISAVLTLHSNEHHAIRAFGRSCWFYSRAGYVVGGARSYGKFASFWLANTKSELLPDKEVYFHRGTHLEFLPGNRIAFRLGTGEIIEGELSDGRSAEVSSGCFDGLVGEYERGLFFVKLEEIKSIGEIESRDGGVLSMREAPAFENR